ncbi:MAG: sirohydrochlorin chelatase [Bacteroidales bacterium]|nr:sirohydrochlorin chelatase [Bacteroidales bacterium]
MSLQAILLCGHGSRKKEGVEALVQLSEKMQKRYDEIKVDYGFLELSSPTYYDTIRKLYDQGIRDIVAIPVFLFTGIHLNYEIPGLMKQYQNEMEGLKITLTSNIGINEELIQLAEKRIIEAEYAKYGKSLDHSNDILLTAAVGNSLPEANAEVAKLTRLIWEKINFGFSQYAFSSKLTFPSVAQTLQIIKNCAFGRIIIFPALLFPSLHLDKIFMAVEEFRKENNKEVVFAEPFGVDEFLIDILVRRHKEVSGS